MAWLTDAEVQELRMLASTTSRCCHGESRCRQCRLLDGVDQLCAEVELRRWSMPVVHVHEACSEQTRELVAAARALDAALGHRTPLSPEAHSARSQLREASADVMRWVVPPTAQA